MRTQAPFEWPARLTTQPVASAMCRGSAASTRGCPALQPTAYHLHQNPHCKWRQLGHTRRAYHHRIPARKHPRRSDRSTGMTVGNSATRLVGQERIRMAPRRICRAALEQMFRLPCPVRNLHSSQCRGSKCRSVRFQKLRRGKQRRAVNISEDFLSTRQRFAMRRPSSRSRAARQSSSAHED